MTIKIIIEDAIRDVKIKKNDWNVRTITFVCEDAEQFGVDKFIKFRISQQEWDGVKKMIEEVIE